MVGHGKGKWLYLGPSFGIKGARPGFEEGLHGIVEWAFPDRMLAHQAPNRAFVMEVVYGIVRHKRMLEWVIARLAAGQVALLEEGFTAK